MSTLTPVSSVEQSPHISGFVDVNGINLNYLEWGGQGPPLVMIHGLCSSPHVFDDLAPLLRDSAHGIAYARRGHGQSDAGLDSYDAGTLREDLRQFLDRLKIHRATLLGWGMGGNEITAFAGRYADRVDKLIYLEGGYELADRLFLPSLERMVRALEPDERALESLDAFRDWYHAVWIGKDTPWSPGLEAFVRDITRIGVGGRVTLVPDSDTVGQLFASLASSPRDYTLVKAPALAIYGSTYLPHRQGQSSLDQEVRDFELVVASFRKAQIRRLLEELPHATVTQVLDRTHLSIGCRSPQALAMTICEFIGSRRERRF
jgi:pimeloyl-ACP methyl ester carboxylesterase